MPSEKHLDPVKSLELRRISHLDLAAQCGQLNSFDRVLYDFNKMALMTFFMLMALTFHFSALSSSMYRGVKTGSNATCLLQAGYSGEDVHKCHEDNEKRSADCESLNLTKVPDNLSQNVQILSLSFNLIHSLFNSSFLKYPELTSLKLVESGIRIIDSGTFLPLKFLQRLDISGNDLTSLPVNAKYAELFVRVKNLKLVENGLAHLNIACPPEEKVQQISLSYNKFQELTKETLRLHCDVDILKMVEIPFIRIDPDTIASLRVQTLWFGSKSITTAVWRDLLIGIAKSHIKGLYITDKMIITSSFFSPLDNFPLQTLELNSVDIEFQNTTPLAYLNLLTELTIENSNIPAVEPEYFSGMEKLQILRLESNRIKLINPNNSIWNTTDVREIFLGLNDLEFISRTAFQGLNNLSLLDLAHNTDFKRLIINSFTELFNLQYLNVSNTALEEFDVDAPFLISITSTDSRTTYLRPGITFRDTPLLEWLDLSNSKVSSYYICDPLLSICLFDGLISLAHLVLKDNPIYKLEPDMFRDLTALEFLDLSHCEISLIELNVFRGLSSLHTLSLAENKIQELPYNHLIDLKALLTYNLTDNNLAFLDSRIFVNTTSLQTLLLSANKFVYFNQSAFEPIMSTLTSIDISKNPLICNCEMSWLVKWLDRQVKVLNDNDTVCSTAPATLGPLVGKPVLTFIPSEFCGPNVVLMCTVPLAVITFFAVVYMVYHFRWLVRYKLYLLKLAVIGYEEIADAREHGDFEYDLNFMFMEDDAQWVQEHLRPVLEERLPDFNRNAFGDNDLILGMHYFDAVYHIIERSFKTVLLLSRAAFQDNWFMIKFRIAFEQVNDARTENVVLIFLEDIPDAELPYLVRLYLSERRTYLWWTENVRGQEYFWNELILTLQRDNLRWNILIPPE